MKILKYTFSILLLIWGLLIGWFKLYFTGLHFPFLTVLTLTAIVLGVFKYKKANVFFLISACLWILLSAETMGFVLFFDGSNYERMLIGFIPFVLGIGLLLSNQIELKWVNTLMKKFLIVPALIVMGISSYIYKSTIEEINCWYYFENEKSYNVVFAIAPKNTFEVRLDSDVLKNQVKAEAIQYKGRDGYYCPETKVRVVSSFGKITSAKIISFRNTEINKKVNFSRPAKIPLDEAKGKLEILKPITLNIWN